MAEENATPQEEQPKKKKGLMIAIIIVVQLIVAILLVVFVIYPRLYPSDPNAEEADKEKKEEVTEKLGPTFTISDLTVNPKGTMGRRFAVFEVVLEVDDPTVIESLNQNKPVIVDQFLTYLRGKTVAELASLEQMKLIRNDLMQIVNRIINQDAVTNLYFTRFVLE